MVDHPFKRKRSGGPKTAAGKAMVAGNALSHGINSHMVTLPTEDPAEFDVLFQGLVADFRPNGTIETSLVHRIAHLMWKQRRLESYEHQQISQAAAVEVKIEEIFKKMNIGPPSDSVYSIFEFLDEFTQKDLKEAEALQAECEEFQENPLLFMNPVGGPRDFPDLWRRVIPMDVFESPNLIETLGLNGNEPDPEMMQIITDEVKSCHRHSLAKILLIKNREGIHQARAAIRAEKITLAWNLDRSHHYHTLLEGQIYRALKELRTQQTWPRGQIAIEPLPPVEIVG